MKITDIVDLSDDRIIKDIDFTRQYIYANILVTVYSQATEFSLRLDQNRWHAGMRKDGDSFPLVEPLDFKIDELLDYLHSLCHGIRNSEDLGDVDGIVSFRVDDELIFGLLWFGNDMENQWVSLRLLYGESAPDAAKAVLERYNRRKIFG